jgi:hypothetical protein
MYQQLAIFSMGHWAHGVHVLQQLALQDVDMMVSSAHGNNAHPPPLGREENCISRESNPGHIDGNDVFYH